MDELVHWYDDGRGERECFLNGKQIFDVRYANERKGVVRQIRRTHDGRILLHKHGKRALERTLHGQVVVKFIGLGE